MAMAEGIFRVDDGSTWHFDAKNHDDARAKWLAACVEIYGQHHVPEDEDEPEITRVQLTAAASVMVTVDGEYDPCEECGGSGHVIASRTLLEVWQREQAAAPDKKSAHGVLCNSEWP